MRIFAYLNYAVEKNSATIIVCVNFGDILFSLCLASFCPATARNCSWPWTSNVSNIKTYRSFRKGE